MSLRRFLPSSFGAYIVLAILLLPMFFIGIRDTHDWGDDFAAYLQGAVNLANHQPVTDSKYVAFQNYNPMYAPSSVPCGFSLLLLPVVKAFGLNFKILNYYMSFWLYAFALLSFVFLRRYLSSFTSALLILIFFLNPFILAFKSEVISDLPFCFFYLAAILIHLSIIEENSFFKQLLFGITISMAMLIRGVGISIIAVYGIEMLRQTIIAYKDGLRPAATLRFVFDRFVWGFTFILFYILVNILTGYKANSSFNFYANAYQGIHVWELLMANLDRYIGYFTHMFDHDAGIYAFGLTVTKSALLFCFLLGFVNLLLKGYDLLLIYFFVYAAAILLFPFSTQGFRYFFPLLPIIILFIAYGARSISISSFSKRYLWAPLLTLLVLLQYRTDLQSMHDHQSEPIYPTPISAECKAGFNKINELTSDKDLILSTKPRACAFFADRHFCVIPGGADAKEKVARLNISKPNFILVIKEIDEDRLESIARFEKDSAVYEDSKFKLYRRSL